MRQAALAVLIVSQAPSMPLYTDALLGDTLHLSTEEFGAYCLILFATWRNNGRALPDDDRSLARICRVSDRKWREKLRPRLAGFFDLSCGNWTQNRLQKEWDYVAKLSEISRANALNRWHPGHAAASDPHMRPQSDGNATQTHKYNNKYLDLGSPGASAHAREGSPAEPPWAQRCDAWARGKRWLAKDGPAPDQPGCLAPPELIEKAIRKRKANGVAKGE